MLRAAEGAGCGRFINLDDEKKFSYVCHRLRRLHSAPGETVISEGEQGSTVYILLEGTMECFVAGVKVRSMSVVSFLILSRSAQVAEIS